MKNCTETINNRYMKKVLLFLCFGVFAATAAAQMPFTKIDTKNAMRKVADWQIANPPTGNEHDAVAWTNAAFYIGLLDWAELSETVDHYDYYYKWMLQTCGRTQYSLGTWMYHADFYAVAQAYIDLYRKYGQEKMMWHTWARTDYIISHPANTSLELNYGKPETLNRWSWCDALFMAPPVFAKLYALTKDKKYINFLNKEYRATYDYLFDTEENLFYRDCRYFKQKEANGKKVFWGRGNGWVLGGLTEILQALPKGDKNRDFYEDLYLRMCHRIADLQSKDGYWHASLLDPASYPSPETSATGFILYALAYGINEGLLDKDTYLPHVVSGWKAMLRAVDSNGKLGYVQPIGADPKKVTRNMTEVYGVGAFLLAGCQIYKMAE